MWTITICAVVIPACYGCEFRRPNDGYDRDWQPDHREHVDESSSVTDEVTDGDDSPGDRSRAHEGRRPGDIVADTASMEGSSQTWSEGDGVFESEYIVYRNQDKVEMIVERGARLTRSYYFDDGALFYYTESDADEQTEIVVEFDDFGDIRGSQKLRGDRKLTISDDELSEIVEHASELLTAATE